MDYNSIIRTVLRMIKEKTGHVVIEANGTGKQPEYPFCTYTVTSPYLPQHRGVEEQGVLTEDIELVFLLHGFQTVTLKSFLLLKKQLLTSKLLTRARRFMTTAWRG